MECQLFSLQAFFTFILFMFMVLKIWKSKSKNSKQKPPPGPWKLPLLGNLHQLVGSLPHRGLRDLAKIHGPVMHLQLGEVSAIVISSPEGAKEVMKTYDTIFAQRPHILAQSFVGYNSTNIGFAPYGDYWRQLRKICLLELLSSKRVQSFRSIREEEVSNMVRSILSNAREPINLSEKIFSLTSAIVSRAAFGKISKDQEEFITLVDQGMEASGGFGIADLFPSFKLLHLLSGETTKLQKLQQKLDIILESIMDEHKASNISTMTGECEPVKDLVDVLLNVQKRSDHGFSLTNDNIKAIIHEIFTAGSEPSSATIEWAMAEMLKNPSVMEKAQAEVRQAFGEKRIVGETGLHKLNFLKLVIRETLRFHPASALLLPRECMKSCEIFGFDVPEKTKVIINAWGIGRDSTYWKDAERFYPERFVDSTIDYKGANFEFIPFGSGRRMCPGMAFAIANIELPLASLLYHFDWKLHDESKPDDLDMTEVFGLAVKKKKNLYLVPVPYHPLSS